MQLRRNFLLSVGTLVALNVLLAFGAIGLLTRMSPAIGRILQENIYSHEVAEEMLALVAQPARGLMSDTRQLLFERALQRARNNITEPEEIAVLERITQQYSAALAGEESAVMAVVQALQRLIAINRRAMISADQEARRLGAAGPWVAVVIAVVSFVISLLVIHRLERFVLNPLIELYDVLEAVRAGNHHRRCRVSEAPEEIRRVLSAVNSLLDQIYHGSTLLRHTSCPTTVEHSALLHFLEQQPAAMVLVDERGKVVASNSRGLAVLSNPEGIRVKQVLEQLPTEPLQDEHIESIALKGASGWLCVLHL
jgi:nitrogen fixation/metabolism regulation signal transduction histidine kinase